MFKVLFFIIIQLLNCYVLLLLLRLHMMLLFTVDYQSD